MIASASLIDYLLILNDLKNPPFVGKTAKAKLKQPLQLKFVNFLHCINYNQTT